MLSEKCVIVLGNEIKIKRLTLRGWTALEGIKKEMDSAISKRDYDNYYLASVRFIEMALSIPTKIDWEVVPWWEFLEIYAEAVSLNTPTIKFPILESSIKESKPLPWEYEGRGWFFWFNLFAKNYGWSENYIGALDIDTAIGLYQELSIDDQFQKEWEWSLSEIAFPYNQASKKQEYKPLERPEWMLPISPKSLPIVKMRKDMMPVGNIVDLSVKEDKRGI